MNIERRLNAFMSANISEEIDENRYNYSISEINDILSDLYYKIGELSIETIKIGFNKFVVKFKISNDDIEQLKADSKDFKVVFREIVAQRDKKNAQKYEDGDDETNNKNKNEDEDEDNGDIISPKESQKLILLVKELKEKNKIYIGKVAAMSKKVKSLEAEVKILRENL